MTVYIGNSSMGTTPRMRGKVYHLVGGAVTGNNPARAGKACRSITIDHATRINPAFAGKREDEARDQEAMAGTTPLMRGKDFTTIQFSFNCGLYPISAHTAAATSKTTRPFYVFIEISR